MLIARQYWIVLTHGALDGVLCFDTFQVFHVKGEEEAIGFTLIISTNPP